MKHFIQATTLMGVVIKKQPDTHHFSIQTRSGDVFDIRVRSATEFRVLQNLDGVNNNRFVNPLHPPDNPRTQIEAYIRKNQLVAVQAIYQVQKEHTCFDATCVHLLTTPDSKFLFEQTHWWLNQCARLADEWLDDLFGDHRNYNEADFAKLYRTNLNIIGLPTDENIQEMATLSRLIYGLSSTYLLTGCNRYLQAATAGVRFQREAFRSLSHDGRHCFWAYGRRRQKYGTEWKLLSENPDDHDAIPLYEQIYALAGLAQYYRITADWEVLEDIRRTIRTFNDFYLDEKAKNPDFPNYGGYFSHLDYATMRPDSPVLGENQSRKNWNSIGDHIPAYLINVLLALEPLPLGRGADLAQFVKTCREMLDSCVQNILSKFPDLDSAIPYVNERFFADWQPDHNWGWQQNRAIVGHNLKIAWNLTRVANYYLSTGKTKEGEQAIKLATTLADSMAKVGIDLVRGGCFDAVEREPQNGMDIEFVWGNTKDFWQQEQCILAYLILYGHTNKSEYLDIARETTAFWNLFFLDRDNRGIFFRVNDIGTPVIADTYGNKAGHAIAGYHTFELNYLAHLYIRTLIDRGLGDKNSFCLHFQLDANSKNRSINVLPDYFPPGRLIITNVTVNGVRRDIVDAKNFQIPLSDSDAGCTLIVEFAATKPQQVPLLGKIGVLTEKHFDETEYFEFNRFFPANGYEVEYISHLWNQSSLTFDGNDFLATCTVTQDVSTFNVDEYDGFILIGGYAMDRLRYEEHPTPGMPNTSPAARFIRRAVQANKLIGTICHALWLFTAVPELLKGRHVTCAHNIIYDVQNAGGIVMFEENNNSGTKITHRDGNLVTGKHPGYVKEFCQEFLKALLAQKQIQTPSDGVHIPVDNGASKKSADVSRT
jgi:putative intracellular protease/amidase/mannose/cellobiose epimerase-like protein (N-acyl-D-glucosamine 2-epimerase family)